MTTAAERARTERATQGLATPSAPVGDPVVDARVAAAYRTTARVLASAAPDPSSAVRRGAVEGPGTGAAGSTRKVDDPGRPSTPAARAHQPAGSSAPARSKTKKKAADADTSTALQTAAGG